MFNQQQISCSGQIQPSQTGGKPYIDTSSPYKVSECNLKELRKGKYLCMADLFFDWAGFNQICKSLSNST